MLRLAHVCKSLHIWLCTSAHIPANVGANLCTFACTRLDTLCQFVTHSAHLHTSEALHIWAHPCTLPTAHTLQPPRMHQERPPHSHPCGTPEGLPRRGSAPCTTSANNKPHSGGDSSSLQSPRMPRQRANTRKGY